jgi:hypothetical protein
MLLGNTPFLASHVRGDTAWLDVLFVPRDQRHHGWGSRMFLDWAKSLPAEIKKIELLAVNIDEDSPVGFWMKMGFDFEDLNSEDYPRSGCYMVRNAHAPSDQETSNRQ